ncbi:histone-lysine N-methyltransferase ATXR3 isoform X21 [Andrographis paniculata]|uniref:histone-lysine N-methyltransferase ATXR3 isoform X19 n=1 Tax=Andrographis paniculata TaxID=175694 RepID=UPI0021E770BE|nr:histone-lysine N-methyltransferase ATXR3 isoform X19 [Andrographis paniculata]XP_051140440.1 histone-lysine N-methyltransferase ATXR3 isoform X20 [Andrographis paniculata]XP_051140442.1 histone-lysine N-methyltransferase ATXR3 isoform X21 [Andrographis paniculata]
MGDGGVACVPSQHIMEKFSICSKTNGNTKLNSSSNSTINSTKVKPKMKPKKESSELSSKTSGSLNSEVVDKNCNGDPSNDDDKEEVEEGELGTLPVEHGEFIPDKPLRRFGIKSEIEKGEFIPDKWRKIGNESEVNDWRSTKDELEKGEFLPDRWFRSDPASRATEFDSSKVRRYDSAKGRLGRRSDHERTSPYAKERVWRSSRESELAQTSRREKGWKTDREWSPPSGREKGFKGDLQHEKTSPSAGKYSNGKELGKSSGSNHNLRKPSSRYESERTQKINSKIVGEEGYLKNDFSSSKSHARDYSFSSRIKQHGVDSESGDRKYHVDYEEHSSSKNRKPSDDASRSVFTADQYSGRSTERQYKPSSASSRSIPSERSSRYLESSRAALDRHNGSPHHSDRSPRNRARNHDQRASSPARHRGHPYDRSRSPYERKRHNSSRHRSPSYVERSPRSRDRTPTLLDRSPRDHLNSDHREANRKVEVVEKQTNYYGSEDQEGKQDHLKDSRGRKSHLSAKELSDGGSTDDKILTDKTSTNLCHHGELSHISQPKSTEFSQGNGVAEEPSSMEEDMDICNTPPHVSQGADAVAGKWYYLDHIGVERGPSTLSDLKTLVKEGYLVSDHLIKHSDSDRWITVEKAVSPLVNTNFHSILPDSVLGLACLPEAPGNILADSRIDVSSNEEMEASSLHPIPCSDDASADSNSEDLHIDDRVRALLEGVTLTPGSEAEMLSEVLQLRVEQGELEPWGKIGGHMRCEENMDKHFEDTGAKEWSTVSEFTETAEKRATVPASLEKDNALICSEIGEMYSSLWACKGCDWKRNDDATQDRTWKRKLVLNDGYPLCQMPKSGCEDPRWEEKDELYFPSQSRRLDLPLWAFTSPDELNDSSSVSRAAQAKSGLARGIRGAMLSVVRINACVVKDHGSFVSEARTKVRGKERLSSRSVRVYSTTGDTRWSSRDGNREIAHERDSQNLRKKDASLDIPKDHLCKVDELKLHLGDWYFLDGTGHERGPQSFSELQIMADHGIILKNTSVFRKQDNIWVPLSVLSDRSGISEHDNNLTEACGSGLRESQRTSTTLHNLHPQVVGYTRGKLHELVMKSYKSREFAAAINEVLDPWINSRQQKKEIEKHIYHSDYLHPRKRARLTEIEEYDVEEDMQTIENEMCAFDDLRGDATFRRLDDVDPKDVGGVWDLLDGHVLARVFHFLRADLKSLFFAGLTCKHWRSVMKFYKDITRQINFCALAPKCSDSVILKIMGDYKEEKITSLLLRGCTGITSGMLEEILRSFPFLSTIDVRGCTQFEDLVQKFPNIQWVQSRGPHLKIRSLNHLVDGSSASNQTEDSSGLKEYLESSDKRDSANQLFRRSLYKRSKLFDARKSSSILSRDAQLRRLAIKKIGSGYKRMEEYIAKGLQDIMSKNTFEFFGPKVAAIEERMRNGYYARRGLNTVKEDISRMCREAIKHKNRGDARDMNRIVALFIHLATCLDKGSKLTYSRDGMMKSWKDESPPGFSSASSKYKKNLNKLSERKHSGSLINGIFHSGDYASDREIRRRLSKLNSKYLESGSDTSDDFEKSSGASMGDSASTASDTESDLESPSDGAGSESRGESYFIHDDGFDSFSDDREWGARMTKASLVPPVTRKYEVIDHYVIVTDEEEVRRKMLVSLPEDYDEKLNAQRNGTEESDMEIPEVKDYKPRKSLGDEVIEQEVYGIDPYTHNLLLDSMPEESGWSLLEKHIFIEEVMLRTLNKKVRHFTGSGNTPMMYPLKPVFEEIFNSAKENNDQRTMGLCQSIIRAIDSRPVDNYVAYRKGLGVVCNKEGGFGEDDFVVEFLGEVYPTWKWFEKQDGIRALQKNNNDPVPEFYNIYLERPKGDADGYDLVVVDAMHKANYASRICHSCRPNCEAKVTAVDGQYQIGIYAVRPIAFGEEITFDYNSVTESKEEYEASVCLCGNQVCRGSFLNLTGEGAFQKVLKEHHGLLDRHLLLLEACELNSVTEEDYIDLGKAGLGSCLLGGLPDWLIAYSARLVRFINFERTKLPDEILRHNIEEKKKYFAEIHLEVEKSDAEIQAEGVYNQRLQNLALTIDKVKYVLRCVFGDPKNAPPPLERLSPNEAVSYLWKGEGSLVEELIQCMAPHMEDGVLRDLKANICLHDPSGSDDTEAKLRKSLLWLRDEVRNLACTYKSRHDATADLIHLYAYTKCFFRIRDYKRITSPPVYITPLDLGPKYAEKLGSSVHEYCKTYGERYCLGQLMFWHSQNAEPDCMLAKASRGCLSLPDVGSFYAKVQKPSRQRVYGPRTVKFMLSRMEKQPQRAWPKDRIWSFKNWPKLVGSPMLDAVLNNGPMNREMIHWLKHRPPIYHAMWDR